MAKKRKSSGRKVNRAAARAALARSTGGPRCRSHPLGFWYIDEEPVPQLPTSFSSMIPSIMALYGPARRLGVERFCDAWNKIYIDVFPQLHEKDRENELMRMASFRGGKVRIEVANSLILHEASFSRDAVLRQFQVILPDERITDVIFTLRR